MFINMILMTNFLSPCVASNAKKLNVFQDVEEEPKDERSVDDLLSFINGPDGGMPCFPS